MLQDDVNAIRRILEAAQSEAEDCASNASSVEDEVRDALNRIKGLALNNGETIPSSQCHFIIKVDDLAQALLDGRVPSRSVNGSGNPDDARSQAMAMLSACNMYL
jgi:hypothetical protein